MTQLSQPGIGLRDEYDFETINYFVWLTRRKYKAGDYLSLFINNLGLSPFYLGDSDRRLLSRFVVINHLNAQWYWRAVSKERCIRVIFVIASLALMLALPVLVIYIPKLPNLNNDAAVTAAQITGALTGLLGIQKILGAWLGQRRVIGRFWRTRSALVDQIYNLEAEWRGRASLEQDNSEPEPFEGEQSQLKSEFRALLIAGIKEGRTIVRKETEQYFDEYSAPDIQLSDVLSGAQNTAATLVDKLAKPQLTVTETRAEKEQEATDQLRKAQLDLAQAEQTLKLRTDTLRKVRARSNKLERETNRTSSEERELKELMAQEAQLVTSIAKDQDELIAKRVAPQVLANAW